MFTDTQTSILSGIPESARCVQRFDDSLNSAIHITYRISLRSSSMREPRDPLLKVVFFLKRGLHSRLTLLMKAAGRERTPPVARARGVERLTACKPEGAQPSRFL